MYQTASLQMEWCLDCHRAPQEHIRPRDKVFDINFNFDDLSPSDQAEMLRKHGASPAPAGKGRLVLAEALLNEYHVAPSDHLTKCYTCHR